MPTKFKKIKIKKKSLKARKREAMSNSISVEPEMKANNNQIISGAFKSISLFFFS